MSTTFDKIRGLVGQRKVRISAHAYQRLIKRGILPTEVVAGALKAEVLEEYPDYHIGPAVLVLQSDGDGAALHAVWGIEKGTTEPAVLATAYHPDPSKWTADFRRRRS